MRDDTDGIKSPNSNLLGRMIGKGDEGFININNVAIKALIDSGSQISTIIVGEFRSVRPASKVKIFV